MLLVLLGCGIIVIILIVILLIRRNSDKITHSEDEKLIPKKNSCPFIFRKLP